MVDSRQLPLFDSLDGREHRLTDLSSLTDAIDPFKAYLRSEGKTQNTIVNFASDLKLLCENLGADIPLGKITHTHLKQFLRWLEFGRGIPCSRKSYARRVTTMKVFFKWLKEDGVRRDDPAKDILQRSGAAPLQSILSHDEIKQVLEYTLSLRFAKKPDARPDMLVRLLLDTGIKKSEAMRMSLDDINRDDPDAPFLMVRHYRQKNVYKERIIELDPDWLEVLDEYVEQYAPEETIFTCTARNLEYILTDAAKAAGVQSRISFEILRWTSAVMAYLDGVDMDDLRTKMGLSKVSWRETSEKIVRLARLEESSSSDMAS
jgi:integrase/recombinase XerD